MAKNQVIPPQKHTVEYWDYHEVVNHLEKLHGKSFQDFWRVIIDCNEVSNGCFIHLPDWDYYMKSPAIKPEQKQIMQHFYDFLGEDYHKKMWASW